MAVFVVDTLSELTEFETTTLREAIIQANRTAGADRIEFADGLAGQIQLLYGQISISDDLVIAGNQSITITGDRQGNDFVNANGVTVVEDYENLLGDNSRIFNITSDASEVTLEGLTLTGGRTTGASALDRGGAVYAGEGVTLTIADSTLAGNSTNGTRA